MPILQIETELSNFQWNSDFSQIISRNNTGRVTIKTLNLNRPNLIKFRLAVALTGEHPPIHTLL